MFYGDPGNSADRCERRDGATCPTGDQGDSPCDWPDQSTCPVIGRERSYLANIPSKKMAIPR